MDKNTFLTKLRKRLKGLPEEDLQRTLDYYREMIEDRMEEGLTEEEAVADIGSIEEIAVPLLPKTPRRKLSAGDILLLVLGFPVWFPVLVSLAAVVFSVVVTVYAVAVSLVACAAGGILGGVFVLIFSNTFAALFLLGAGLVCGGLSVFFFALGNLTVKGCVFLVKTLCRKGNRS